MSPHARTDIRLAGAGGQGVVLAGRILAEAALISGRNAVHTQVYGPESRGGASRSDVVISTREIIYPLAEALDVLVALTDEAYQRYGPDLIEKGMLILDREAVQEAPARENGQWRLPMSRTARRATGSPVTTGVVALGVLNALARVVDPDALERAVTSRVPSDRRGLNLEALAAGVQMVEGE